MELTFWRSERCDKTFILRPKPLLNLKQRFGLVVSTLLLFSTCSFAQTEERPDVVLKGTLKRTDHQTYLLLPFTVPDGVHRISVEFSYTGREQRTTIDLGLFDPEGFRGWSGGNKSEFTLADSDATPSYLPGPIRPGVWKLALGVPNIRPDVSSEYTARIFFSRADARPPLRPGASWYRGDLHLHTAHSDGSCKSQTGKNVPCPVFKTLENAQSRRLDFIAISDHNTTSHYDAIRELQPYFDQLLLLDGREITTFQGHANVYGTERFVDFRVGSGDVPDMNTVLRQTQALGAVFSINHPNAPTGEQCMGCGWHPQPQADLHLVQAVEAVNSIDPDTPYSGISFWETQLNAGYRLTGIGGSDSHNADKPLSEQGSIGRPTTVVYAPDLSANAILNGIRAGHVFIDIEGSHDRLLELTATAGRSKAAMGDVLRLQPGGEAEFSVHVIQAAGGNIEVIEDGKQLDALPSSRIDNDDQTKRFSLRGDGQRHWIRVNVRSSDRKLLLVSNPIYLNF